MNTEQESDIGHDVHKSENTLGSFRSCAIIRFHHVYHTHCHCYSQILSSSTRDCDGLLFDVRQPQIVATLPPYPALYIDTTDAQRHSELKDITVLKCLVTFIEYQSGVQPNLVS